jgi:crotonobetainyl-CoA:carnitine CoA-transferase CaiB-like acyl-CoA transferase
LFATNDGRAENAAALHAILASQFETRDLAEWRLLFRRSDIKFAPLPRLDDVVNDPQLRAANAVVKFDYPGADGLETVNSPVFVSGVEKRKPTAAPEVGEHTREVLQQLGYGRDEIESIINHSGHR